MTTFQRSITFLRHSIAQREFLTAFVATLLGVLTAFVLNDLWHESQANSKTKYILHQVVLESQYNGTIAYNALKTYSETNKFSISIERVIL